MDLSGADYHQLRAFAAVGELRSFSKAAEQLGVSPSALSQLVRSFEERVGVRLLNRTTRSVSLTDAGRDLLERARPAIDTLGNALESVRRYGERPSGTLRVVTFRAGAERFLAPMMNTFLRSHPDVVLDLTLDDEPVDVVAHGYDAAIRIGEVIDKDLVAVRIGPDMRQVPYATPRYVKEHGRPKHPRDLVHHRCIRWLWPGCATPYAWEFYDKGAWFEVAVDGPLIVNDKKITLQACKAGLGIGFFVESMVADDVAAGRLVPLLEKYCAPFPGYFLCYPQQRQMAPALRAFIDAVRAKQP